MANPYKKFVLGIQGFRSEKEKEIYRDVYQEEYKKRRTGELKRQAIPDARKKARGRSFGGKDLTKRLGTGLSSIGSYAQDIGKAANASVNSSAFEQKQQRNKRAGKKRSSNAERFSREDDFFY